MFGWAMDLEVLIRQREEEEALVAHAFAPVPQVEQPRAAAVNLPVPEPIEERAVVQAKAQRVFRRVYSFTYPHTVRRGAKKPNAFSREAFAE